MEKIKILIVEDTAIIALQLKMSLKRAGYDVLNPVATGIDAVVLAHQEMPDFILMDIQLLGDMDGIEAAQKISEFSRTRIIFTTGHSDIILRERAMALQPTAYLNKPVELHDILSIINQQIG